MNTRLNAPRSRGRTSIAACSVDSPGNVASNAVINDVSLVASFNSDPGSSESSALSRWLSHSRSSRVLVRLPLWPRAIPPVAVGRKVGWAFIQTLAPVVEYRQGPLATRAPAGEL